MSQPQIFPRGLQRPGAHRRGGHNHVVRFYDSEEYLYSSVVRFASAGLAGGNPVILIATADHRTVFCDRLETEGYDLETAAGNGQFVELDAHETLTLFMDGNLPDRGRFEKVIGGIIEKCSAGNKGLVVQAYGEMVDVLWRQEKPEAAICLEELWNELAEVHTFDLLCAYALNGFYKEAHQAQFSSICRTHTTVYPTERYTSLDEEAQCREITFLQQRSLALETELQQRKQMEASLLELLEQRRKDAQQLERTALAAEKSESFLTAIVRSADDAIVSKTLQGIVTSWNPGAEKLFGYSASEMIGQSISILVPPDQPDEEPNILKRLVRGESIEHYETRRVRKDGTIIDISLTVSPVRNHKGEIIGASKIARDITQRKQIQAERDEMLLREQQARSEAEIANRLKDEFLALLSHELRTPLNAILGWTDILSSTRGQALDSTRHAVEVIQRNAKMQKRLIEDLLDMSRILSGKLVIKREKIDLAVVLRAALDSVRTAASAKHIQVDLRIDESVGLVTGDADRLQQVVWNLLANAIKFTPLHGRVELRLKRSDVHAEIVVQDTGDGISPEFLPHVFERFCQADGSTTRSHGGLGLGLAVVRYLVEAHGGRVRASSAGLNQGSTFVVSIPNRKPK